MRESDVLQHSVEFLTLMSRLAPPHNICFRTFAPPDRTRELHALAQQVATGGDAAAVSLTLRPGDAPSFHLRGTHALATLQESAAPATRMAIIVVLLVLLIVVFCVFRNSY